MKISKFVQTIKSTGQCAVIHAPGEIYLSTGYSIYKAPELPDITGMSQIAAVLDVEPKKLKKIHIEEYYCKDKANILGFDLSECPHGELETMPLDIAAVIEGNIFKVFVCRDNGEMIFFDESLLAPIKDRIKKEDAYIDYTARIHPTGDKYIVVKDGIEVLAAILPVKVLSEKYIKDLREFYLRCDEQYKWQQAAAITKDAEQGIQEEVTEDNE